MSFQFFFVTFRSTRENLPNWLSPVSPVERQKKLSHRQSALLTVRKLFLTVDGQPKNVWRSSVRNSFLTVRNAFWRWRSCFWRRRQTEKCFDGRPSKKAFSLSDMHSDGEEAVFKDRQSILKCFDSRPSKTAFSTSEVHSAGQELFLMVDGQPKNVSTVDRQK